VFVEKFTDARVAEGQERDPGRNRDKEQKEPRSNGHVLLEPREPRAEMRVRQVRRTLLSDPGAMRFRRGADGSFLNFHPYLHGAHECLI
jgi:hypothetical protein